MCVNAALKTRYQQWQCRFSIRATLQSSKFCQQINSPLILCHVKVPQLLLSDTTTKIFFTRKPTFYMRM